ncbi:RNA polymerase sigma factor [Actinomadura fibrosa]|uniref:Sigma-70 family RNA polymerase sigma factor n=1 Tax=Actinomadura fibrosa TaxID=111802 RepID=A0ABW2XHA0_9ACTN|nr:sigma-70 family RNA polymerase sigma factor [Actinomadura fibrosa]
MEDHLLVEALRRRDPGAAAAVYGAYADRLYAYCWFQLRSRDAAQVALRDTFIVAEAHIEKLRDPDRFGPWLYAIARVECGRRLPPRDAPPDVPVASHDQEDVDQRITAWQAVLALRPVTREILELRVRHQLSVPDLAAVFDLPVRDAQVALDRAHGELEEALTAEILAQQGPYGCAERAALLRERHGDPESGADSLLMVHAQVCEVCGAFRPRTVSAAKVYGLLPDADPPEGLRLRVMSSFLDPDLVGYRLFVATRVSAFTSGGFPVQPRRSGISLRMPGSVGRFGRLRRFGRAGDREPDDGAGARAVRVAVVLAVVVVLAGGGLAAVFGRVGSREDAGPAGKVAGPRPSASPGVSRVPGSERPAPGRPEEGGTIQAAPVSATFPLGAQESAAPLFALPSSADSAFPHVSAVQTSSSDGRLSVSPLFLDLAGGADGTVELRAGGRPVAWHAKSRGPVRASPSSGRLKAGEVVAVDVHVSRSARSRGEGDITFQPGGIDVHVMWRPDRPAPGPDPSPSPTGTGSAGPGGTSKPSSTARPEGSPTPRPEPHSSAKPSPVDPSSGGQTGPPASDPPGPSAASAGSPTPAGSGG